MHKNLILCTALLSLCTTMVAANHTPHAHGTKVVHSAQGGVTIYNHYDANNPEDVIVTLPQQPTHYTPVMSTVVPHTHMITHSHGAVAATPMMPVAKTSVTAAPLAHAAAHSTAHSAAHSSMPLNAKTSQIAKKLHINMKDKPCAIKGWYVAGSLGGQNTGNVKIGQDTALDYITEQKFKTGYAFTMGIEGGYMMPLKGKMQNWILTPFVKLAWVNSAKTERTVSEVPTNPVKISVKSIHRVALTPGVNLMYKIGKFLPYVGLGLNIIRKGVDERYTTSNPVENFGYDMRRITTSIYTALGADYFIDHKFFTGGYVGYNIGLYSSDATHVDQTTVQTKTSNSGFNFGLRFGYKM